MRKMTWCAIALFVRAAAAVGCEAEEPPKKDFSAYDGDGDGDVTIAEWAAAGGEPSVVTDFDDDASGTLSASEFTAFETTEGYSPCDCSSAPNSQCWTCVGGHGECSSTALYGSTCNDGDGCTTNEYCQEGGVCGVTGDGGINGTEFCGFDESKQGKLIGDHVKNFAMKTPDSCPYYFHQSCGTGTKVIWVILSTGW